MLRCIATVYRGALDKVHRMVAKKQRRKAKNGAQPRASVTFPPELYSTLKDLARR